MKRGCLAMAGAAALFLLVTSAGAQAVPGKAKSVTRHDITWTFDRECATGTFVNGDPWVLGPVTIVSVEPGWDGEVNGSQVDPPVAKEQGFRTLLNAGGAYNDNLRARFPLTLTGTRSLVSTVGIKPQVRGGAYEAFETASVLTVVETAPARYSFRPPYIEGPKPIFTASQIRWDRLPMFPVPAGFTPPAKNPMERFWMDHSGSKGQANGVIHPRKNMEPYYFFMTSSQMAALVLLDFPRRNEFLYSYVQYGIDCYHVSLKNGDAWRAYGGFGNGRKWPILFAGILLDSEEMMRPPKECKTTFARTDTVDKFGEDGHTWYGKPTAEYPQGKPLWGQDGPPGRWFGNHDIRDHANGESDPEKLPQGGGYRFVCSQGWAGAALACRLMGAMDLWDHPAYFDYVDRWIKEQGADSDTYAKEVHSYGNPPIKAMWKLYREKADDIGATYKAKRTGGGKLAPM